MRMLHYLLRRRESPLQRQGKMEYRSFPQTAVNPYSATMLKQNVLGNRKLQPRAPHLTRAAFVHPIESLKKSTNQPRQPSKYYHAGESVST